MAIAGFGLGSFIGGIAKSLDERLKDDMRRTAERSDRVREYHVTRAARKEERFEEEQKELQEVLQNLSSYMDKAGIEIPEGMTKADFAAQLYTTGGGTISSGKQLIADLDEHYKKKGDIKGLIKQASLVTKGKGFGDYINNFVRRPDSMLKIPENLRGGVGFLKNVDITKGIKDETSAMLAREKQPEKFEVSGLGFDRSQMVFAEQYKKEQRATDLAIEEKIADIAAKKVKAGTENAWSNSELRSNIQSNSKNLAFSGVPTNDDGSIDIKTALEKNIDLKNTLASLVSITTKQSNDNVGTLANPGNVATILGLASTKNKDGNYAIGMKTLTKKTKPIEGNVYNIKSTDGKYVPHLFIGNDYVRLY